MSDKKPPRKHDPIAQANGIAETQVNAQPDN